MHLTWWKIYFWFTAAFTVLGIIAEISYPSESLLLLLFDGILLSIICIGIYAFLYSKTLFNQNFWKYFLWFNIFYSLVYFIYVLFPNAPYIQNLSFLAYSDDDLQMSALISLIISIPAYYAIYQLSKGAFYTVVKEVKDTIYTWNIVQIALWGYATVITGIFFLSTFMVSDTVGSTSSGDGSDSYYGVAIVAPVLLFWLMIAMQYKRYKWNWWRITLVLNSILYAGLMVVGLLYAGPITEVTVASEYDIIATLQFLIIFVGLIVFGREQFIKPLPNTSKL